MNKLIKTSALLVALALTTNAFAQDREKEDDMDDKSKSIVIRKKKDSKEKYTIIIDGDKVTINGKPVEDFSSEDIEVSEDGDAFGFARSFGGDMHGRNFMGNDFMREIRSNKAFLGVMTEKTTGGVKVTEVTDNSAAEKAGLKEGDVISKINSDAITSSDDLYKAIGKFKPEDKVTITYKRDGKEATATATLGENKQVRAFSWNNGGSNNFNFDMEAPGMRSLEGLSFWRGDRPRLGIQIQDTEDEKGVKVINVEEDEPADKAGLKEDDIITQVNGKAVTSTDDLKKMMKDLKKGDTIKVTVLRAGSSKTFDIKIPKDLKTTDL